MIKAISKFVIIAAFSGLPALAHGAAPSLKLTPLIYQQTIADEKPKIGYVDISNPTDARITITTQVQGFRQLNLSGNLEYYDDPEISKGIKIGTNSFDLGPREAYRVQFTVDPAQLPKGGVYASLFFQTMPPKETTTSSYISESAKVGTLLVITNGQGATEGNIKGGLGFLQFGSGLAGDLDYQNTGKSPSGVAFNPQLSLKPGLFGERFDAKGPLIFPGNTRSMSINRPGNFIGLLPISVTDKVTNQSSTLWVLAATGWWRYAAPIILLTLVLLVIFLRKKVIKLPSRSSLPIPTPAASVEKAPAENEPTPLNENADEGSIPIAIKTVSKDTVKPSDEPKTKPDSHKHNARKINVSLDD